MSLVDYLRILIRRGWIIVLLAVIAAGSAYVLTSGQTPVYRATQKVLLQPSRADLGLSEAIIRLMNSYAVDLSSSLVAADVIEELKLDTNPLELQSRVSAVADQLRLVIQIDVEDTNEQQAKDIASAYGRVLRDYREAANQDGRREDRINAKIQDHPSAAIARPRPLVNTAAGAVLGILLGGVIVFVLEFLESSVVHRREDLERTQNIPVLATIPEELKP